MSWEILWTPLLGNRLVSTAALVLAVVLVRLLAPRLIRGSNVILSEVQRACLSRVRNISVIVGAVGLVLTWLPSLHAFALSVIAFAVALVIATKELILRRQAAGDSDSVLPHPQRLRDGAGDQYRGLRAVLAAPPGGGFVRSGPEAPSRWPQPHVAKKRGDSMPSARCSDAPPDCALPTSSAADRADQKSTLVSVMHHRTLLPAGGV